MADGLKLTFDDANQGSIDVDKIPECAPGVLCDKLEIDGLERFCTHTNPKRHVLDYYLKANGAQCPLGKWFMANEPCWRNDDCCQDGPV